MDFKIQYRAGCVQINCEYYFNLDGDARITNRKTLQLLIEQNRPIIAPMLIQLDKKWSNFWGSLHADYFPPSLDIVENNRRYISRFLNLVYYESQHLSLLGAYGTSIMSHLAIWSVARSSKIRKLGQIFKKVMLVKYWNTKP